MLKTLEANSVEAVVTDPPYGLKFMGKSWDYDVPSVDVWREVLRVLKPGGHLLSFGGTRTYHRMVVNIEDAGFEIRDQIQWLYGSGFPKSHDVSKAIDKLHGAEREVVGSKLGRPGYSLAANDTDEHSRGAYGKFTDAESECAITAPATDDAKRWAGWGTALKPAFEPVVLARKPLTGAELLDSLVRECQSKLFAEVVKSRSKLSLSEKTQQSIAQWIVGENTLSQDDLSEVMATLQSESETNLSLSIELSWLDMLGGILSHSSMFTTEMASSLTTDLKTLNFYLSKHTQSTTQNQSVLGSNADASPVPSLLSAVGSEELTYQVISSMGPTGTFSGQGATRENGGLVVRGEKTVTGRWPANVILGCDCEGTEHGQMCAVHLLDEQSGILKNGGQNKTSKKGFQSDYVGGQAPSAQVNASKFAGDTGGASRFFYVAKASKRERGEGNGHPTVKPLKLMQYLIKLITPPNGTVLDPFMGSGSTGVAAKNMGFNFIGIELNFEYAAIAERRLAATMV